MTKESVSVFFVNAKIGDRINRGVKERRVDRKDFKIKYWISAEGHLTFYPLFCCKGKNWRGFMKHRTKPSNKNMR